MAQRVRHRSRPALLSGLLSACLLVVVPAAAQAFEVSGGVSMGGLAAGIRPRFAVSPHIAISWQGSSGFLLAAHEVLSIVPATSRLGAGVYSQTAADLGYAWQNANFSVGPSLGIVSASLCNIGGACMRVEGALVGVHAQGCFYFAGPLGASIWTSVDWIPGGSDILTSGATAMIVAGPVIRWRTK